MSALNTEGTRKLYASQSIVAGTDFVSANIDLQSLEGISYHLLWSGGGNITGNIKLECSLDELNWLPIDGSTQKISGTSGMHIYNCTQFHYRYIRVRVSLSANSNSFDIWINSRSRKN